jgi:hypothetical protein
MQGFFNVSLGKSISFLIALICNPNFSSLFMAKGDVQYLSHLISFFFLNINWRGGENFGTIVRILKFHISYTSSDNVPVNLILYIL